MKNSKLLLLAICLVIAVGLVTNMAIAGPRGAKACRDTVDNDNDGYTDWPDDPGCANKNDNSELNPNIECDDGADNDGDEAIDSDDNGCTGPTDDDETDCGDSVCEGGEVCDVCVADCGYCDSCDDTDGGANVYVFGTVSGYFNGTPYSNDDYCIDSSNLKEYDCAGDHKQFIEWFCGTDHNTDNYCVNSTVYYNEMDYFCATGECDLDVTPIWVEDCTYGCYNGTSCL